MSNAPIPAPGPQTEATRTTNTLRCRWCEGETFHRGINDAGDGYTHVCNGCGATYPTLAAASPEGAQTEGTGCPPGCDGQHTEDCVNPMCALGWHHDGDCESNPAASPPERAACSECERMRDEGCVEDVVALHHSQDHRPWWAAASPPERAGTTTAPECGSQGVDANGNCVLCGKHWEDDEFCAAAPTPEPGDRDALTEFRRLLSRYVVTHYNQSPEVTAAHDAVTEFVASLVAQGQRTAEEQRFRVVKVAQSEMYPRMVMVEPTLVDKLVDRLNARDAEVTALRADPQRTAEERDAAVAREMAEQQESGRLLRQVVALEDERDEARDRLTRAEEENFGRVMAGLSFLPEKQYARAREAVLAALSTPSAPEATTHA